MIRVKHSDLTRVRFSFNELAKGIEPRGQFLAAGTALLGWIKNNFDAQGANHDQGFGPWKKLSFATIANRRKGKGQGTPKILQDTGLLMNRWTIKANNNFGYVQSQADYSSVHEAKGKTPSEIRLANGQVKTILVPQRKIFPSDKKGNAIVKKAMDVFVNKAIRKSGLK